MSKIILTILLLCFLSTSFSQKAEIDTSNYEKADSLLTLNHQKREDLLAKADSIREADSLQELLLLNEINQLAAEDAEKKEVLKKRLDSLKNLQEIKKNKAKAEIDSLRASAKGVQVYLFNQKVFTIYAKLGPLSPSDRAKNIQAKLEHLVEEGDFDPKLLKVVQGEESYDILHGDIIITSIMDRDAFWLDQEKSVVANTYKKDILSAVKRYEASISLKTKLIRIGLLLLVILVLYFAVRYLNKLFTFLNKKLVSASSKYLKGIRFKDYEFLTAENEIKLIAKGLKIIKWGVIALLIYLSLPIIFSIFPSTEKYADQLFSLISNPVKNFFTGFVNFLPQLFTIVVIVVITRFISRYLKFLAGEVESEKLKLGNFHSDWALPTFKIINVLIWAFAFIIIFPYLPGSDSPAFQGVSVFLGILISLGSSTAIGNMMAGLVITYMRPYKLGDRVKIGDVTGDVVEKTLLVTRIRTIKNEDVTIPNSAILTGNTVNYSSSGAKNGLVLHTTVTIGYDVPWKKVHELLIEAALKSEDIENEPKPFVLQTSLDDFYVSYQLNAYTKKPETAAKIYSSIHSNIQDGFNEAGVEILSPHYRAARDGNSTTIPPDYLSDNYEAPSFNINLKGKD